MRRRYSIRCISKKHNMENSILFLALMLPGTLFLGLYDVLLRKFLKGRTIDERFLMGINYTAAGIVLGVILMFVGIPDIKTGFFTAFLTTLLLGLVSQRLWYQAFAEEDASLISPLRLLTPPLVLATGFFILQETPSLWGVIGIVVTIAGLYMLLNSEARRAELALMQIVKRKGVRYAALGAVLFAFSFPYDKQAVVASSGIFLSVCMALSLGIGSLCMSIRNESIKKNIAKLSGRWYSVAGVVLVYSAGFLLVTSSLPYALAAYASSVKRLLSFWAILFSGVLLQEKNIKQKIIATLIMLAGVVITLFFE